ncbi:MAG: EthD domain-containing protein [Alphaproteobacteria bacterium]|nr:EthD domain-containing protein [Alphaproteobacteria bacterium]MBU1516801.1 EthD domain-containing protein [Alphaproteobacteria bacterium]MBU2092495.1 EthD domain-containing protein [Alphaproteobacteria bacterium]MBU2152374.1 EthD domain-containing protein [Alphaproteobacteria bacterium]MBU2305585.1 EthD domain-containing protein [Alphaproteobacteria bacterium]
MFKMSFAVYRRPDLTQEQFLAHWRDVHAPLAVKYAKDLRIKRYVQLHGGDYPAAALMTASRNCQPPHDGVVEIWWESEAERLAASASPEGQAAGRVMHADELNFCDMSRATICFGYEHVVIGDAS